MCLVPAEKISALYDVPCLRNGVDSEGFSLKTKISTKRENFAIFIGKISLLSQYFHT